MISNPVMYVVLTSLYRSNPLMRAFSAYKNIAQTVVQGILLNDDSYRMPEFLFPALVAELTRSDSITWSTLPESTDTIKVEERVLEGTDHLTLLWCVCPILILACVFR